MTSKPYEQIISEMSKKLDVEKWKIERLVRTERAFVTNQAQLSAYYKSGIKQYRYLARLDERTSEACRELNDKVFDVDKAQAGENYPPMHPYCRSVTEAVFDKDKEENRENEEIKKGKKSEEELKNEYDYLLSLGNKNSHSVDSVSLHPFQTFEMYKDTYNAAFDLIAGIEIKGTKIKNLSAHSVKRMLDRGITPQQMKDILTEQKNVGKIEYDKGKYKFELKNNNDTIIINPNTGSIITIWYDK